MCDSGGERVDEPFDVFYIREQRGLVALAYALTGSRGSAEDIAQEALLAAGRRWESVGHFDNPLAWTRRVVANRSTSLIRRRITEARTLVKLAAGRPSDDNLDLPSESEHVWAAVRQLPRRQAQVITLRALHGLSLQEMGDVLGVSKETVQTHLTRARAKLSHALEDGPVS